MSKVESSVKAAETALRELVVEGLRVSQYAVEKRAGLANGALNYAHPLYKALKEKIAKAKASSIAIDQKASPKLQEQLKKESALKIKYRRQRDEYKELLRKSEGEKLELAYQLHHLQKYLKHLEQIGIADANVLEFSLKGRPD